MPPWKRRLRNSMPPAHGGEPALGAGAGAGAGGTAIGEHGLAIFQQLATRRTDTTLNVLTDCNAGWLATVD
jgi:hypothetical protein